MWTADENFKLQPIREEIVPDDYTLFDNPVIAGLCIVFFLCVLLWGPW